MAFPNDPTEITRIPSQGAAKAGAISIHGPRLARDHRHDPVAPRRRQQRKRAGGDPGPFAFMPHGRSTGDDTAADLAIRPFRPDPCGGPIRRHAREG